MWSISGSGIKSMSPALADGFLTTGPKGSPMCIFKQLLSGGISLSSMKVKVSVTQACLTLCDLMDHNLPGSSVHGIIQEESWSRLPFPPLGDVPPTLGSNPGLLHCRWILYCLSHQGSPKALCFPFYTKGITLTVKFSGQV